MDSFEVNKIIAAILLVALIIIGIGKISDVAFHIDKPEKSAYKVETLENSSVSESKIKEVVEKPSVKKAPSNKAVIGRYILPKTIFNKLSNQKPGKGGEIHITDAIQSLINDNEKFIAHNFTGKYLDCGTMDGFIKSNIEIGKL